MYNQKYYERLIQFRNEIMESVYASRNGVKDAYPEFLFDEVTANFESLEQWEKDNIQSQKEN